MKIKKTPVVTIKIGKLSGIHYLIRGLILFGLAMYILFLNQVDHMSYYIAPRMENWVNGAALGLYLVSAYQVYVGLRASRGYAQHCECHHIRSRSPWKSVLLYGLFILPLLLGFFTPDNLMNSTMAAKRGVNLGGINTSGLDPKESQGNENNLYTQKLAVLAKKLQQQEVIRVDDTFYMESISAFNLFQDDFSGKKIEIIGFVYRPEDIQDNLFILGRFALQCCTADAVPYGIMVRSDAMLHIKNDTWIKLRGVLEKTAYRGRDITTIHVSEFTEIEEPASPYVYQNLNGL
jgi:putative membrane protein